MKLCSIVPLNDLDVLNNRDYNMLLVHLCNNPKYVEWAKKLNGYKIMDNSIIELGESFSFENLLKFALICNVNEIILPDVFKNGGATYKLAKDCIKKYNKFKKENPMDKLPKLMAVCHGNNLKEFKECFNKLNQLKEVDVIGIPKVITTWCGCRSNLFNIYSQTNKEIHLLGCWYSLKELNNFNKEMRNKIRTIDTCLPALTSLTSNDPFKERDLNRTIDLENDKININNYYKIINEIDNILR